MHTSLWSETSKLSLVVLDRTSTKKWDKILSAKKSPKVNSITYKGKLSDFKWFANENLKIWHIKKFEILSFNFFIVLVFALALFDRCIILYCFPQSILKKITYLFGIRIKLKVRNSSVEGEFLIVFNLRSVCMNFNSIFRKYFCKNSHFCLF
jgi:hypothetical protein